MGGEEEQEMERGAIERERERDLSLHPGITELLNCRP